jgi:threonine dehydrogenase-like Zn-dependent dehydrogenase
MSENEAAKDEKRIGVGIIGAGRIGLVHLEALSSCPAARPVIISNPTISKAQAAAATYPGMAWTDSDMDVIQHPDVDAVWICSPSQFHAEQITACAMAGKDIFCEKPIGKGALRLDPALSVIGEAIAIFWSAALVRHCTRYHSHAASHSLHLIPCLPPQRLSSRRPSRL